MAYIDRDSSACLDCGEALSRFHHHTPQECIHQLKSLIDALNVRIDNLSYQIGRLSFKTLGLDYEDE